MPHSPAEAILDVLRIISLGADVVWPSRSCDLTPLYYYLWGGALKGKCYADKPETIDALKYNIREAIGEIQLHTIDNAERKLPKKYFFYSFRSFSYLSCWVCVNFIYRRGGTYSLQ